VIWHAGMDRVAIAVAKVELIGSVPQLPTLAADMDVEYVVCNLNEWKSVLLHFSYCAVCDVVEAFAGKSCLVAASRSEIDPILKFSVIELAVTGDIGTSDPITL